MVLLRYIENIFIFSNEGKAISFNITVPSVVQSHAVAVRKGESGEKIN